MEFHCIVLPEDFWPFELREKPLRFSKLTKIRKFLGKFVSNSDKEILATKICLSSSAYSTVYVFDFKSLRLIQVLGIFLACNTVT